MRVFAIPMILLALTVPTFAAEDAPKDKKKAEEPGTHVQMPFLIAPMNADGKLQGYAYITSKLVAATPAASVQIRDKLAFIQDAFVRDVNAQPIGKASDPLTVDTVALVPRLIADAKRVVGDAKVVTIIFTQIQFSPLHPKTTTQDTAPPIEAGASAAATPAAQKASDNKAPAPGKP